MVRKTYERVMCERGAEDRTKTATYWPPALPAISALFSQSAGLLNRGPWGPNFQLGLVLTASIGNNSLQTLISNSLERPVAPGYIIVWHPPASVSVAFALNSTHPQSRLSPDIFERMHLLFTQVHFLFDNSTGSEVSMLQYDTKQSDDEVLGMLESWGMHSTLSLSLLPGPFWPGMVVPERVLSMGWIELTAYLC